MKVRNGSIYFNIPTNRLERVVASFNTNRVWTCHHGSRPEVTMIKSLRMASKDEVEAYLNYQKALETVSA